MPKKRGCVQQLQINLAQSPAKRSLTVVPAGASHAENVKIYISSRSPCSEKRKKMEKQKIARFLFLFSGCVDLGIEYFHVLSVIVVCRLGWSMSFRCVRQSVDDDGWDDGLGSRRTDGR